MIAAEVQTQQRQENQIPVFLIKPNLANKPPYESPHSSVEQFGVRVRARALTFLTAKEYEAWVGHQEGKSLEESTQTLSLTRANVVTYRQLATAKLSAIKTFNLLDAGLSSEEVAEIIHLPLDPNNILKYSDEAVNPATLRLIEEQARYVLSRREYQALLARQKGLEIKQIADELDISFPSVVAPLKLGREKIRALTAYNLAQELDHMLTSHITGIPLEELPKYIKSGIYLTKVYEQRKSTGSPNGGFVSEAKLTSTNDESLQFQTEVDKKRRLLFSSEELQIDEMKKNGMHLDQIAQSLGVSIATAAAIDRKKRGKLDAVRTYLLQKAGIPTEEQATVHFPIDSEFIIPFAQAHVDAATLTIINHALQTALSPSEYEALRLRQNGVELETISNILNIGGKIKALHMLSNIFEKSSRVGAYYLKKSGLANHAISQIFGDYNGSSDALVASGETLIFQSGTLLAKDYFPQTFWSDVYEKYEQQIQTVLYQKYHLTWEEAEEVTQETYYKVLNQPASKIYPETIRAFLYRIAINGAFDILRRRTGMNISVESFSDATLKNKQLEAKFENDNVGVDQTELPVEAKVFEHERQAVIKDVLEHDVPQLLQNRRHYQILINGLLGIAQDSTGKLLNMSRSAVKSQNYRAIEALRIAYATNPSFRAKIDRIKDTGAF